MPLLIQATTSCARGRSCLLRLPSRATRALVLPRQEKIFVRFVCFPQCNDDYTENRCGHTRKMKHTNSDQTQERIAVRERHERTQVTMHDPVKAGMRNAADKSFHNHWKGGGLGPQSRG